ncbi:MAG: metal ABC transporter permease [Bacteroidales bacterium]|jgi:zinc/manganese transport system permease protein|nr:metal ABC transporter permease [Bacteroidales bacterium]
MGTLLFLAPPIVACIILAGILSYYGNHILSRGIIFIDIAVAQIAALGTMIGIMLGFAESSVNAQLVSYAFTIIILAIFSFMRVRKQVLPQEAIIGIFYCVALGMALLLAEKIPGGSNYITKTITGNVLWVTWKSVFNCLLLFIPVIIINLSLEKTLKKVSHGEMVGNSLARTRMYDLVFYITFGIIIVKSVPIMGIFLVFMLLIGPASIARIFVSSWKARIIWSWIIGALGSLLGIYLSYSMNISNGPAIVSLIGIAAYLFAFARLFASRRGRKSLSNNQISAS